MMEAICDVILVLCIAVFIAGLFIVGKLVLASYEKVKKEWKIYKLSKEFDRTAKMAFNLTRVSINMLGLSSGQRYDEIMTAMGIHKTACAAESLGLKILRQLYDEAGVKR